jgi:hypothetical protein
MIRCMTWTAPVVHRVEPPYVADERSRLDAWLDYHRATLMQKCAGLTGEQLAKRPVASSALSLLGLVRHAAGNERIWFRIRFAQADVDDLYQSPEHPEGGEFALAHPETAETDFATYMDEVAQARMVVRGRSLDERFGDETVTVDLRWLYAHMIDEYARHNGHADLIRELIDGATGLLGTNRHRHASRGAQRFINAKTPQPRYSRRYRAYRAGLDASSARISSASSS